MLPFSSFPLYDRPVNIQTPSYKTKTIFIVVIHLQYIRKGVWCLMPLSTIFHLYRGGQFFLWGKPEYPEKTTDLPQINWKLTIHILHLLWCERSITMFNKKNTKRKSVILIDSLSQSQEIGNYQNKLTAKSNLKHHILQLKVETIYSCHLQILLKVKL
jgi:hypothetical protein